MVHKIINYDNGLQYIHIPTKTDMISIGFIINAGSRDENIKNSGISHFLEHMLFKGTKKRNTNKLLSQLDNLGSYYNAMTTYDYTGYELHGNKKDLFELLDIFIDLYLGANLYQKDINKERKVILEEYNMVNNDIDEHMLDTLMYQIFEGSSLSLPIIGIKNNIKKFKKNDLVKYRNKYYCPSNTIFLTIGNIDYNKISNILYNKIKIQCNYDLTRLHIIPIQKRPRLNITNINGMGQVHISFGFHHNGYLHPNQFNLITLLISTSLTSGSSSKLFHILRTKCALAYNCSSYNTELEDTSVFIIKSSVDEKKCDLAIEKILEVLYKLIKYGIDSNELKRCKKNVINKKKLNQTNMDLIYHYMNKAIQRQGIETLDEEIDKILKISKIKFNLACKHIFRNNNINLVIAGKISNKSKNKIIHLLDKWYYLLNK